MQGNLKQALQYASQNPTSDFATQLATQIKSGQHDALAKSLGIDLTPIKQSSLGTAPAPVAKDAGYNGLRDPAAEKAFGDLGAATTKNVAVPLAKGIVNTGAALQKRIGGAFDTAIQQGAQDANKPILDKAVGLTRTVAHGLIDVLVGGTGDIISNMVSPFIPQNVKDVYGEATAQAIADTKDVLNKPENAQVKNVITSLVEKVKQNPELTQSFGDAINVALMALGGKGVGATKDTTGGLINTGADLIKNTVTKVGQKVENAVTNVKDNLATKFVAPTEDIAGTLIKEGGQITPEKAVTSAWKDIQPKSTTGTDLAYAKGGNVTEQGMFSKAKATPSPADAKLIENQSKLYENGTLKESMSPNEKQAVVNQRASQLNQQQKEFLATNDKAVVLSDKTGSGIMDKLYSVAKESSLPFSKDVTSKGAYDSAIETFQTYLKSGKSAGATKGATTLSEIDAAITKFDKTMENFGAWEKTKTGDLADSAKARLQAIRDIHTTARDFIAENLPPNSPWKAIRAEESTMYQISDRLGQRVSETMKNGKVVQTIKRFPIIRDLIRAAGFGTGLHLVP